MGSRQDSPCGMTGDAEASAAVTARCRDRRLHVLCGGVDVARQIELQRDSCGTDTAAELIDEMP